ncbi:hypothetical protein [Sporolactobacillus shoreicorticis]|uniref:Uncharacterized protein n=1 Tax=Sporolactobacillus shoreicorticis TaxID=1923877 RepID=A0ABW5S684_9BACL|nr:hypothetical protein [Sporolactobacillus shoreicorticis]
MFVSNITKITYPLFKAYVFCADARIGSDDEGFADAARSQFDANY